MNKVMISLLIFLLIPLVVYADNYTHPLVAFCEHRGYNASISVTKNIFEIEGTCFFNDGKSCKLSDFYYGRCGVSYQTQISCRKEGKVVFQNFEKCCEGLEIYEPDYVLSQPICISKIKLRRT